MKLIYFVQYFPPEKAAGLPLVEDLLEGFANSGWEVDLYTPTPTRGVTKEQREYYKQHRIEKRYDGKVTIHRMHLYGESKGFIKRAIRYMIFSLECLMKGFTQADLIFTGSGPPTQGVIGGLIKTFTKKKFIYNLQDIFPDSLISMEMCSKSSILVKLGRVMEKYTYEKADAIITISDDMYQNVIQKNVDSNKLYTIRNWIDTEKVRPVEKQDNKLYEELGLKYDKFYITYAGNIGRAQGIEYIIDAAYKLKNNYEIMFVIFGNGSEEDKIKQMINDYRLHNVIIHSLLPTERISEVYSLGDLSIISCKPGTGISGMPSKTWTIMACGTPILGFFDLGGEFQQIVEGEKCGVCVEAGNVDALVNEILELYKDRDYCRLLGNNAREYALNNVSKHTAVDGYVNIINKTFAKLYDKK